MALLMLLLFHYLLHSRAVHSDAYQTIKEVSSVTFAAATQTTSPSITLRLCGPRLSPAITPVHVHMRRAAIYCALPVDCKCVLAVPCRTIQRVTGHRRWLTWRALALLHSCTLALLHRTNASPSSTSRSTQRTGSSPCLGGTASLGTFTMGSPRSVGCETERMDGNSLLRDRPIARLGLQ